MKTLSDAASYVLRFINQTNQSVFLTGQAGTGKTTLLREIIQTTYKNTVVVAPTGIAALNAGGVTIHSMFQLPFAAFIPDHSATPSFSEVKIETRGTLRRHFKMSAQRKAVLRSMELLVIDEVSMLRADLLDAIDFTLQSIRRNSRPFGGVQVLYIGDLLQLPPVVKSQERQILAPYYRGNFFFHSHVVQQHPPVYIELSKIYRQTDTDFISILNNLRHNEITGEDVKVLNRFVRRDYDSTKDPGCITLTTHNAKADTMNAKALNELNGKSFGYEPEIIGDFPEKIYPVEFELRLKEGAQIMFVKNDLSPEKQYYNGKTGIVKSLSQREILVYFPSEDKTIEVERYEWKNIKYSLDEATKDIKEEVLGTFVHYPIKLAWAITVHKSQGLTFDRAVLDVSQVFAPGQAYVALSRLRSLNGLILLSPLQMNGISSDEQVMRYAEQKTAEESLGAMLEQQTRNFLHRFLKESFTWKDLSQAWRNHAMSYRDEGLKSVKFPHQSWAKRQSEVIASIVEPAQRFTSQLDKLFSSEVFDPEFISGRIAAAHDYFLTPMDNAVTEVLWKLEEISRRKKAKAFLEELLEIEEMQTMAVLQILRAKRLIDIVASGAEINKENLQTPEIANYRKDKLEAVRKAFLEANVALIEDPEVERYTKNKPKKEPRKATIEETFELWQQKNPIAEIAKIRKLTPQTISGHIAKLIEAGKIDVREVFSEDKLIELARAFVGYREETLNGLKEKYGEKFTWDELRMFRAGLNQDRK